VTIPDRPPALEVLPPRLRKGPSIKLTKPGIHRAVYLTRDDVHALKREIYKMEKQGEI